MKYRQKYHIAIFLIILELLVLGAFLLGEKIIRVLHQLLFWGDGKFIDLANLLFSAGTMVGVGVAVYKYWKSVERQRKIDLNSVSVNVAMGNYGLQGIFEVKNYGAIPHQVEIQKAILNDGTITSIIHEEDNPRYGCVFSGTIKPGQVIKMHFFNIVKENTFVFRGAIKVNIDSKEETLVKVRFSGDVGEKIADSFDVHPIGQWVIYSQEELKK